ncbi:MAG: BlaI/MecI/CopY family transcriptional regulator [Bacteroidota bacterium]
MNTSNIRPTESELAILRVLWREKASTVRAVNEQLNRLSPNKEIGYTTTLKLMQIMHTKGLLSREKQGKLHIYSPVFSEEETQQQLLNKLVDSAFQGSAMKLVMQALGNRRSTPEELAEIRDFLDSLEE